MSNIQLDKGLVKQLNTMKTRRFWALFFLALLGIGYLFASLFYQKQGVVIETQNNYYGSK